MIEAKEIKVRLVTAAALFDGHDAAINIMRRILQSKGAEIIHLGHNRSVAEIVECAIEEDVQGIAITSYQGGHVEFFKYMKDLLVENGCGHIKIFGGGGGTILPAEIEELHNYGITRIYSPDDGRRMGLGGMIQDVIDKSRQAPLPPEGGSKATLHENGKFALGEWKDIIKIAKAITAAENGENPSSENINPLQNISDQVAPVLVPPNAGGGRAASPVVGITGTGGAGKSSVTDEIVRRFLNNYTDKTIAVISVDPSKKKTGGALLGDRIRMNSISSQRAYMRSLATRESDKALSNYVTEALQICKEAGFDLIILESAGVGQSDASILEHCDVSMYVMTPEYGAPSQLEKINMLDYADVICLNKFDKAGALDALHDVRKQYKRNYELWDSKDEDLPVVGTIAAQFNDAGVNTLFDKLIKVIAAKTGNDFGTHAAFAKSGGMEGSIIPPKRVRYLAEIAETIAEYDLWVKEQAKIATKLYQLGATIKMMEEAKK
jgi:methylmalonyl-CoA mutase